MRNKAVDNWETVYMRYYQRSVRELAIGIADWKQRSAIILEWLRGYPMNAKILDCGCGIGIAGLILQKHGYTNIVGIDNDAKTIQIASKFVDTYKMNCNNIKLNETFDVVLALNIIEHLSAPEAFLATVKSVLKPSGVMILSLPNETALRKALGLIPNDPDHKQSWNYHTFPVFLGQNGFKVIEMRPIGRFPILPACQTFMALAKAIS